MIHLGHLALSGAGLLINEATAVAQIFFDSLYDAAVTTAIVFGLIIGAFIPTEQLLRRPHGLLDFVQSSGFSPFTVIMVICEPSASARSRRSCP